MRTLRVGFSPCPNDTFMFHGLVSGQIIVPDVAFEPVIEDIEVLNQKALDPSKRLEITKLSIPALARVTEDYAVLAAGAALGRGCGPLVVCGKDRDIDGLDALDGLTIAIPGEHTTANLLLRSFARGTFSTEVFRFDAIMPAVADGTVDAGLVIHESRFTYRRYGLEQVCDLGEVWEEATGLPLPLGIIAGTRELGEVTLSALASGLRDSIRAARENPAASRDYVRQHAQEMSEAVCREHIDLYVNDFSIDLGSAGRRAIHEMLSRGRDAGLLPDGPPAW